MSIKIQGSMPNFRDMMSDPDAFPVGYRWPQAVVERRAKMVVKDHLKLARGASLPPVDYDVDFGSYGIVHIRAGKVVRNV